jgi:hypothetical protein
LKHLAAISRDLEVKLATAEFNHFALALMKGAGDLPLALGIAQAQRSTPARVLAVLKSAVAAGTTTDVGWAKEIPEYHYLANGFVEALRNVGVFDRLLSGGMRQLPLRTRIVATTTAALGANVAEGKPKPITRLTLAGDALEPVKASAIVVLGEELIMGAQANNAMGFLGRELQNGVALSTDTQFFASILNGVSPLSSTGSTSLDALTDLQLLLAEITTGASSVLYLVTTPAICKQLSLKCTADGALLFPDMTPLGGSISGVPILISDGLSAGQLALIDASGLAGGSDAVILDATQHATLEIDDSPDDPTTAGTVMTSLWQSNLRALRGERWFGVNKFRASSVALLEGADYHNMPGSGS